MEETLPMGIRFSLIHRYFKRQMDIRLKEHDLTGVQLGVLGALERLEHSGVEEVNQRDLENASHVTHPTMTAIIKRLEKKEFISCRPSQKDRRYKCIYPTDRAKALHAEFRQLEDGVFQQLCSGLSEEQVSAFLAVLDVMLANACSDNIERSENCVDKKTCTKY